MFVFSKATFVSSEKLTNLCQEIQFMQRCSNVRSNERTNFWRFSDS